MPPGGWQQPPASPAPYAGQLAGWWSRAGAWIIDALIVAAPVVALAILAIVPLFGAIGLSNSDTTASGAYAALSIIGALVFILAITIGAFIVHLFYGAVLMRREGQVNGQTWGKQLLGIRVVRVNGQPYDFGAGLLRQGVVQYLLFWVVGGWFLGIPTLLNYLWPLWDEENRALHDMMCDSRVIQA
ncbi:MAG: hypothetical protein QOG62_1463 [Thermoleophilaceae bacterium]|nr:hypothetical protein [Thermoleophilaceae bacterium]